MNKNVGLTYVKDFTFPAEQGFTGSASSGVHQVKGYQRGGVVKRAAGKRKTMPKNVKMKGGEVHAQMGGYLGGMGQEREITVDDVTISVPKSHGGKMSMHDKLYHEGGKMGYAYGGQVKPSNTSSEFKMTKGKQDTMDDGNQPARRGRNQAEIEAGGTKRLQPGLAKGGKVKKKGGDKARLQVEMASALMSKLAALKGSMSDYEMQHMKMLNASMGKGVAGNAKALSKMRGILQKSTPEEKARGGYMKGGVHRTRMPKNVKSHGGLAKYAAGGVVKKAGAAL